MNNYLRQYFPNSLTFLSLACGLLSIILSSQEYIMWAGLLILLSVILDILDGFSARKLKVESGFGMQLDSLADMVSFGVAPLILTYQHLAPRDNFSFWILPFIILPVWAGAFRLSRFNLQPPKRSIHNDTVGITITQSGAILTLAVLSDLSSINHSLSLGVYLILLLVLSYLMISKLKFPSPTWFFPSKRFFLLYLTIGAVLVAFSSFFTSILVLCLGSLAASISRNIYLLFQHSQAL
ncbi:MAG: CDP-diacylglycerol--serine O-phosphatidyltransferase [Anaerolineales bacterium]|nr:CDP-diacylglycerol--serine O-phosphatidyltransferase [Anaerolineales bacterium]